MTKENFYQFDTIAQHGGQTADPATGARAVPIYQTTSYLFKDSAHAANLFKLQEAGYIYSRNANPTNTVLEERIAELEGGVGAFAVSSGQAAISTVIFTLTRSGDDIVSTSALYGGTYHLFSDTFPEHFGITVHFADGADFDAIRNAITEKTKALYTETLGNPGLDIADIEKLSEIAHENGIPLIVDSTFSTPYLERPIEFGADIVIHSATKFIGGHGTSIGGLIIDAGTFDWTNGKFPGLTKPDPSIGNRSFVEAAGEKAFVTKARFQVGHDLGFALAPFNSWLFIQGLETLPVRMERHVKNARKVAEFLAVHDQVEWVNYPTLESDPQHRLAEKYLPKGAGAIFTFGIKGGFEAAQAFIDSVKLLSHLANVGDAKTLVIHPTSTTHARLSLEEQRKAGVTPELIRLSIGLEDAGDIIEDIGQALAVASQVSL